MALSYRSLYVLSSIYYKINVLIYSLRLYRAASPPQAEQYARFLQYLRKIQKIFADNSQKLCYTKLYDYGLYGKEAAFMRNLRGYLTAGIFGGLILLLVKLADRFSDLLYSFYHYLLLLFHFHLFYQIYCL